MPSVAVPAAPSATFNSVRPRGSISSTEGLQGILPPSSKAAEAGLLIRDLDEYGVPPPSYIDAVTPPGATGNNGGTKSSPVLRNSAAGISPVGTGGTAQVPSPHNKDGGGATAPGLVNININLTQNHFSLGLPPPGKHAMNIASSGNTVNGQTHAVPVPQNRTVFSSFPTNASSMSSSIVFSTSLFTSDTLRFVGLCFLWYSTSAITNNVGKSILNLYDFPVTLTIVQFGLTGLLTWLLGHGLGFTKIRPPTRDILLTTAPLSMFQIVGHVMSSIAISYVPVSFAHTIKALSPLFTVLIYRIFFNVPYSQRVYSSIILVTTGVMLVITNKVVFHATGFFAALGSCIIFVVQNIFSKKLFSAARAASAVGHGHWHGGHSKTNPAKLDKLNLLFYSATTAFVLMIPLWIYSDGVLSSPKVVEAAEGTEDDGLPKGWYFPGLYVSWLFLLNGLSYFAQNVLAFTLLSMVSPVTYSVASLVKRIFVIVAAMVWFADTVSWIQGIGICVTFFGLWMYQGAKGDVARGEAKLEMEEAAALAAEEGHSHSSGKSKDLWASGHHSPKPTGGPGMMGIGMVTEGGVGTPLVSSRTPKNAVGSMGSLGSALGE